MSMKWNKLCHNFTNKKFKYISVTTKTTMLEQIRHHQILTEKRLKILQLTHFVLYVCSIIGFLHLNLNVSHI